MVKTFHIKWNNFDINEFPACYQIIIKLKDLPVIILMLCSQNTNLQYVFTIKFFIYIYIYIYIIKPH